MITDIKPYHICIIEDNPGDVLLIEEYLGEQIALPHLSYARSFREAKSLLLEAAIQPDVILLDLSLPDNKGEGLILDVLAISNHIPVIVLTGHTDIEFSVRSLSLGASDYLLKDDITANSLYKSIIYSIERKKALAALKESEMRYSNLFHLSPQPMWVYDLETLAFLDVNVAAEKHYGYTRKEFFSMTLRDIRPREDVAILEDAVAFVRQHNMFFTENNYRHRKKNGEIILVNIKSNIVEFKGRKAEMILANDITELVTAQQQLKEAYTNIVQVEEQERERFAAEIHDGIAQNLVAMQLMFPVVKNAIPAAIKPPVLTIFSETLDHTILECKEIVNNVRPKDLIDHGLVYMVQQLVQKMNAVGKLTISFEAADGIDGVIDYNTRFHLYRIIQENINNTMKYANASKASIVIEKQPKLLDILFTDNGVGTNDEMLKAESSFLSLKRRLSVLGGSFNVMPNPEGGLSFHYQIPLVVETSHSLVYD
jgi:PAS domain S-box-containing protein